MGSPRHTHSQDPPLAGEIPEGVRRYTIRHMVPRRDPPPPHVLPTWCSCHTPSRPRPCDLKHECGAIPPRACARGPCPGDGGRCPSHRSSCHYILNNYSRLYIGHWNLYRLRYFFSRIFKVSYGPNFPMHLADSIYLHLKKGLLHAVAGYFCLEASLNNNVSCLAWDQCWLLFLNWFELFSISVPF